MYLKKRSSVFVIEEGRKGRIKYIYTAYIDVLWRPFVYLQISEI